VCAPGDDHCLRLALRAARFDSAAGAAEDQSEEKDALQLEARRDAPCSGALPHARDERASFLRKQHVRVGA
jgi:hypothetical protein